MTYKLLSHINNYDRKKLYSADPEEAKMIKCCTCGIRSLRTSSRRLSGGISGRVAGRKVFVSRLTQIVVTRAIAEIQKNYIIYLE